jgi:alkylated DNA repair dioxygenase AlkB
MRGRGKDQAPLFDYERKLPNGFAYYPEFLSGEEEETLVAIFHELPLVNAPYKEYTAKRRILNYGLGYDEEEGRILPGEPLPAFLRPMGTRAAARAVVPKDRIAEALITQYEPGVGVGWHCDNEPFQMVIGVSLGSWGTMQLRPLKNATASESYSLTLEPRSVYILQGESRWAYQHRILPTTGERFSVTLRTLPTS